MNYDGIERYSVSVRVFILVCYFFILKKVWHKPEVRLIYGYSVAVFNLLAVFFFSLSSIKGNLNILDAFAFGFLHAMVAIVMITLVHLSKKIENKS